MKFKDVSDITMRLIDKIDILWSYFFIANLGVSVWIISDENSISLTLTLIATIAYLAYSYINCIALIRAYKFLEYAISELKLSLDNEGIISKDLRIALQKLRYNNRITVVIMVYLFTISVVLYLLWEEQLNTSIRSL